MPGPLTVMGAAVNTGVPVQAAVGDGPNRLNTIVPPAVAVTPVRVEVSDTVSAVRVSVAVALVTMDGLTLSAADCSCPHVDDTTLLLASPLKVASHQYLPACVGVKAAEVAVPSAAMFTVLVKTAVALHAAVGEGPYRLNVTVSGVPSGCCSGFWKPDSLALIRDGAGLAGQLCCGRRRRDDGRVGGGDHRLFVAAGRRDPQVVGVAAVGGDPPERPDHGYRRGHRTVCAWSVDRDRVRGDPRRAAAGGSN